METLETLSLDLGSIASIRSAADTLLARHARLDLLLNNAGVMVPPAGKTAEGFETQFGTNHLGHFAFTGLLLERLVSVLKGNPNRTPKPGELPVLHPTREALETPSPSGLRVTWLGHSTVYLEMVGVRILTDPVWGPRASPLSWAGPARWYAPPIPLEDLPRPQVVVISHDHYDHLDRRTIQAMGSLQKVGS